MPMLSAFFIAVVPVVLCSLQAGAHWDAHCNGQRPNNATCSRQLPLQNLSNTDCFIQFVKKNSTECENLQFQNSDGESLGKVRLKTYLFNHSYGWRITVLNVTFSDVKWDNLRMQYKQRDNPMKNYCRVFILSPDLKVPPSASLYHDCRWSNEEYEGLEFDFKYEAHNTQTGVFEGKHYIFQVPSSLDIRSVGTPITKWKLFNYIDISSLPDLIIRWQQAPQHYNVTHYKVEVFQETENVACNKVYSTCVPSNPSVEELSFLFNVGSFSGKMYFTISMSHEDCIEGCLSKSPVIKIDIGTRTPLVIGIVGSVVLLPVFLYAFYVWKRYGLLSYSQVPVVLLVYRQTRRSHVNAVVALAKYLRDVCKIEALIDELDIPISESQDPFIWYQDAFSSADAIMVVSSPLPFTDDEAGIYHNVDVVGLRLLAGKYSSRQCHQKFFTVVVPYCKESDIPVEAKSLPCFTLMNDLNEMLWYIYHGTKSSWFSKLEYLLFQSHIIGSKPDFKCHGGPLLEAFAAAELDLVKLPPVVSNNCSKDIEDTNYFLDLEIIPKTDTFSKVTFLPSPSDVYVNDGSGETNHGFPGDIHKMNLLGPGKECPNKEIEETEHSQINVNDLLL